MKKKIEEKNYKTYKVLGRDVKIEIKPVKMFSFKWNWKQIFSQGHQAGWHVKDDKAPMPWNAYTEELTVGQHQRTFDYCHTVLKYKIVYPFASFVYWLFFKRLEKKGYVITGKQIMKSKAIHNVPLQLFEQAYDEGEDDWIKYYLCRYNYPYNSWSKKKHAEYKKGNGPSGLIAFRIVKNALLTIAKYDSAYREFVVPFFIRLTNAFNRYYAKNPVEHVMYVAKNIDDVQYRIASEVLHKYRLGQNFAPPPMPPPPADVPSFNPRMHVVDEAGKVRLHPWFKWEIKNDQITISVDTEKYNVVLAPNGELNFICKNKRGEKYGMEIPSINSTASISSVSASGTAKDRSDRDNHSEQLQRDNDKPNQHKRRSKPSVRKSTK